MTRWFSYHSVTVSSGRTCLTYLICVLIYIKYSVFIWSCHECCDYSTTCGVTSTMTWNYPLIMVIDRFLFVNNLFLYIIINMLNLANLALIIDNSDNSIYIIKLPSSSNSATLLVPQCLRFRFIPTSCIGAQQCGYSKIINYVEYTMLK